MKTLLVLFALLLQTPTPATYSVSGSVVGFSGAAMPSTLRLRSYALHEGSGQGKITPIHADGTFEFTNVLPGECDLNLYDTRAPFPQVGHTAAGSLVSHFTTIGPGRNFTFSGPNNVTELQIKAPAPLNGRFVIVDGGAMPAVAVTSTTTLTFNSSFHSGRSMWTQAIPGADAQFTLGVFPGANTIAVGSPSDMSGSRRLPGGYAVKSMTYGAVDVMANGLVLTGLPTSTLVITLALN